MEKPNEPSFRRYGHKVWKKAKTLRGNQTLVSFWMQIVSGFIALTILALLLWAITGESSWATTLDQNRQGLILGAITFLVVALGQIIWSFVKAPIVIDSEQTKDIDELMLGLAQAQESPQKRRLEVTRSYLDKQANYGRSAKTQAEMRQWMHTSHEVAKNCLQPHIAKKLHRHYPPHDDHTLSAHEIEGRDKAIADLRGLAARLLPEHLAD